MAELDWTISSHAHSAGLRRLSARAHAGVAPPNSGGRRVFLSFAAYARTAIDHLRNCRVHIEKGLSDEEFARVEAAYGFTFPPDLKAILHEGLPVGKEFPNWRLGISRQLQLRLDLPSAGLLYEVARGNLWWKKWGPRPIETEQAVRVALKAIRRAPFLVPLYSHCYVSSSPNLAGNPVFFVFRKDVFICGVDVADFFQRNEFTPHDYKAPTNLPDLLEWSDDGGSRVAGVLSGHLSKDRGRTISEKHNLISVKRGSGAGNGSQDGRLSHHESTHPSLRSTDGLPDIAVFEEPKKNLEVLERDCESWGRNLDTLVARHPEVLFKSLDNLVSRTCSKDFGYYYKPRHHQYRQMNNHVSRRSRMLSVKYPINDAVNRLSYFEDTLSSKTLMQFSMQMPPWAAKVARKIEFWSDLPDKRHVAPPNTLFYGRKVDCDVAYFSGSCSWEDSTSAPNEAFSKFKRTNLPKWLMSYFEDMTLRLRKGGWKEGEIEEIMETSYSAPLSCKLSQSFRSDKQSVMDALSRQAEILSSSLREAGWSVRDVAEVLDVILGFGHCTTSKSSPELATHPITVADYVVLA